MATGWVLCPNPPDTVGNVKCIMTFVWTPFSGYLININFVFINIYAVFHSPLLQSLSGHNTPVECVRFSSSEELVAAGSQSGSLKIWDLEAAKSKLDKY